MPEHSNIPGEIEESPKRQKVKPWKVVLWALISLVILFFAGVGIFLFKNPAIAKALYNFAANKTGQVSLENGKVNILLMGKSGADHDGADLTDTMILVSVSTDGNGIKTVSIPRDIWVPEIMSKVNSAYYWGKNGSAYFSTEETGGGIAFAKKMVGEITGETINYGVVIDFSAFKEIVDALGGITINVENSFTDKLYPIEGRENDLCNGDRTYACRYETIAFSAGAQIMDGTTALKFVRSRHAEGDEGTDIAREARQQKIIGAIKEKVLKPRTYLSIKNIKAFITIANKYIETDMDFPTAGTLARIALRNIDNISQHSFPEDLLIVPPNRLYNNLYVFIPKAGNGNWTEIQKWFASNIY